MNDMRKLMEAIDKAENVEEGFRHPEDSVGEQIKSLLAQGKKIMSRLAGATGEIIDIEFSGPFQFAKLQDREGITNIRVDADPRLELIGTIDHYALVRKVDENMSTYKDYLKEGYFSRLDAALDELVANNPNLSADKLVAIARSKYGQEAATFLSDKLEAKADLADFNASDPQPHLREYEEERSYDDFVEYYVGDLSRSIVRKGVFKDLYTAAGEDIDVLNAAIKDEAYSIADSYYGTGDGIGTSDMNHFIQHIGKQLGVDDVFGWYKKKEESIMKSDDEMERDKTNRYAKYNTAIRGKEGLGEDEDDIQPLVSDKLYAKIVADLEKVKPGYEPGAMGLPSDKPNQVSVMAWNRKTGHEEDMVFNLDTMSFEGSTDDFMLANPFESLNEDPGHSIFDILAASDVYHLVDDLEYGRFDNNSSYADILYDYYDDEMPYDTATGDYGDPDEWIKDKLMQDYGDEIDDIAAKMADEQLAAIRKNAGLSEAKGKLVNVPNELSNPDPKNPKATSADAEAFIHALGPDDEVDDYVVDPETGEVLFGPYQTKRGEGMEKFKSARDWQANRETWVPSIYGANNQDDAWEELGDLRYGNSSAAKFYNIVWRNLGDLLGDPKDLGTDAEDWGELDYDTGYDVPVAIKRKDGKRLQEEDYDNFRELASLVKHATGNISLSMMGTTDKGTVARFTPTLM